MQVLEWIVWGACLLGAMLYALGIYLNIKRNNMKIGPLVYMWCAFQWIMVVAFIFLKQSKFNMIWVAPVGFACVYVIIVLVGFFRGFFKGLMMAGKR